MGFQRHWLSRLSTLFFTAQKTARPVRMNQPMSGGGLHSFDLADSALLNRPEVELLGQPFSSPGLCQASDEPIAAQLRRPPAARQEGSARRPGKLGDCSRRRRLGGDPARVRFYGYYRSLRWRRRMIGQPISPAAIHEFRSWLPAR